VGAPYVGFSGGSDDCEELADRPVLELDEAPDRFALEVADVADSFKKAPRTSFNAPLITSLGLGDPCKVESFQIFHENVAFVHEHNKNEIRDTIFLFQLKFFLQLFNKCKLNL